MSLKLPTPIAAYFAAEAQGDFVKLAECFTPDGRVRDEGQVHEGPTAIAAWIADAKRRYGHKTEPLSVTEGDGVVVTTRLSGQFPGSPIEVRQKFELAGDKIRSLVIG